MITGLTEEQFIHLPTVSLHMPCDKCGKGKNGLCDYGRLMRDIADYSVVNDKIVTKEMYTALYLCSGCHWQMQCEYGEFDKYREQEEDD